MQILAAAPREARNSALARAPFEPLWRDRSFVAAPGSFGAANDKGFLVDLIMPQTKVSKTPPRRRIGETSEYQAAAEIEGLEGLQDSVSISEIVIDEKGISRSDLCT